MGTGIRVASGIAIAAVVLSGASAAASNGFLLTQISSDPFTNPGSQHATQVEPDTFAVGNTIVAAFQTGRYTDGGASGIAFATSKDGGVTWTSGVLPSLTKHTTPAGPYDRATDPTVAYDAVRRVWLVSSLVLQEPCPSGATSCRSGIVVSRSSDGLAWSAPVSVAPLAGSFEHDKNWTVCDDWAASPYRGRCYTSWSDFTNGRQIVTSTSTDGGLTWSAKRASPDTTADGLGAIPLARPDGKLVVVFLAGDAEDRIGAIVSTDGGVTFGNRIDVAAAPRHRPTGMRGRALPTAEIDGAGTIYAAWDSCSFRPGCPANDIVLSRSADGLAWTTPERIPIDPVDSGIDHFVPGLAVDRATAGGATRLGLAYYFFPSASCAFETCELWTGFIASKTGGATWEPSFGLSGPMALSSIPDTSQGRMVGDYISTSFVNGGVAVPVFSLSTPFDGSFHQSMHAARIELLAPPPSAPSPPPPPSPAPAPRPSPDPSPTPRVTRTPAAKLLLSTLSWAPAPPVAGGRLTVRVRVRLGPGGAAPGSGRPLCTARVGALTLRPLSRSLRRGVVSCTWRIPATAGGRQLTAGAGASSGGLAAKRIRLFRVAR